MKKRKLKRWVLPSLYAVTLTIIFSCLMVVSVNVSGEPEETINYVTEGTTEPVWPVFNESSTTVIMPVSDNINIKTTYYKREDTEENQQHSLIFYQNTYMPSTGIVYSSDEKFEVVSILDGTVKSITTDDILGNVITIDHGNNIVSMIYSLDDILVKENDVVVQGTVLGKSKQNEVYGNVESMMIEVSVNGTLINPNDIYNVDINNINS